MDRDKKSIYSVYVLVFLSRFGVEFILAIQKCCAFCQTLTQKSSIFKALKAFSFYYFCFIGNQMNFMMGELQAFILHPPMK